VIGNCKIHGLWSTPELGVSKGCPKCLLLPPEPPDITVVAGQDLAKHRDFATYVSLAIQDEVATVKWLYRWPHTDYSIVMRDTCKFYKDDGCRNLGVDINGVGEPIVELYHAMGVHVTGIPFTLVTKDEMIMYTRNLLQRKRAGTPPFLVLPKSGKFVDELLTQMKEQERIIGAPERPHYEHPPDRHDDLFWALNIACYVARPYLSNPYWVMGPGYPR